MTEREKKQIYTYTDREIKERKRENQRKRKTHTKTRTVYFHFASTVLRRVITSFIVVVADVVEAVVVGSHAQVGDVAGVPIIAMAGLHESGMKLHQVLLWEDREYKGLRDKTQ